VALTGLGYGYAVTGKRADSASELSTSHRTQVTLGLEFFLARQYDQAIEQQGKVLELDPNFIDAYYFRGVSYLKKSMYKEGMGEFEKGVTKIAL
jgi:Tfp pilus assembly protein PilF